MNTLDAIHFVLVVMGAGLSFGTFIAMACLPVLLIFKLLDR